MNPRPRTSSSAHRCSSAARRHFAPALAALLALTVGCGDAGDLGAGESGSARDQGVTVTVPREPGAGWGLPPEGVDIPVLDGRAGLLFARGEEPLAVTFPAPEGAAGAGRISLRVMSDGPFAMQVALGDQRTIVARSGTTLRQWKELTFSLSGPLSAAALAGPLQVVRVSSELPVIVEAIRFLR